MPPHAWPFKLNTSNIINKRQNYQLEKDRLMNDLHRPNLPHATTEHMEKRIEELENLKFV